MWMVVSARAPRVMVYVARVRLLPSGGYHLAEVIVVFAAVDSTGIDGPTHHEVSLAVGVVATVAATLVMFRTWQSRGERTMMNAPETHGQEIPGPFNGRAVAGGGYRLSVSRIVALSIVSMGLYWYYWLYVTWVHYQDQHHPEARPVWHALSYLVPVYGAFRVNAHLKAYRNLAVDARLLDSINVGLLTAVIAVHQVVGLLAMAPSSFMMSDRVATAVDLVLVIPPVVAMAIVQPVIDRYWFSVDPVLGANAPVGKGEVLVCLLGVALWAAVVALW